MILLLVVQHSEASTLPRLQPLTMPTLPKAALESVGLLLDLNLSRSSDSEPCHDFDSTYSLQVLKTLDVPLHNLV